MSKTMRNKKLKVKAKAKKSRKQKSGGSYYPYNTNPLRFTSSTTQTGGLTMDSRNTFFPSTLVSLGRDVVYNLTPTIFFGKYMGVDPNPIKQNLGK